MPGAVAMSPCGAISTPLPGEMSTASGVGSSRYTYADALTSVPGHTVHTTLSRSAHCRSPPAATPTCHGLPDGGVSSRLSVSDVTDSSACGTGHSVPSAVVANANSCPTSLSDWKLCSSVCETLNSLPLDQLSVGPIIAVTTCADRLCTATVGLFCTVSVRCTEPGCDASLTCWPPGERPSAHTRDVLPDAATNVSWTPAS